MDVNFIKKRFSQNWNKKDILLTFGTMAVFFVRGLVKKVFFKKAGGMVLIGRGVSIRYAHYLQTGRDFIVEDFAEINCKSHRGIIAGDRVTIGKHAIIRPSNAYGGDVGEGLKIGNNSSIGPFAYIGCSGYIEIGNNVIMGPRVGIFAENHHFNNLNIPIREQGVERSFVKINDDCWIASNVVILAGVTIGEGCVIASGSVVTRDIPAFSVVAGVPAKVIKLRNA
ncbi:MAG: acyltransferase [Sphingobacteriia bacterium]|nr:MAG: acyltransferase [Sphingobacteriia bacterium]